MRPREGESEKSKYIQDLFCETDAALDYAIEQATKIHPSMRISDFEGRILQFLLRSIDARKGVEFGAFTGYSGIFLARALGTEGMLITLEHNPKHADITRESFKRAELMNNTEVFVGPALENLDKVSKEGPFDFVFIDADKGNYFEYLKWAESNVRKGGLIIGDNTFLFGDVYLDPKPEKTSQKAWESMRKFNEELSDRSKYTSIILPTVEGMTVAIKEF